MRRSLPDGSSLPRATNRLFRFNRRNPATTGTIEEELFMLASRQTNQIPSPDLKPVQRIWRTPTTRAAWLWLGIALVLTVIAGVIYFYTLKTQQYPGPYYDPLRLFGIVSFVLVLLTIAYTLRRRFMRHLPGNVQGWLWLHTWFGIAAIIIALWHANFMNIYPYFTLMPSTLIEGNAGMSALYGLLLLVLTGIIGRLLDTWQARVIAHEANRNGVGIQQAVEERLHELDLTIGRLSAGKSAAFKDYCTSVLRGRRARNIMHGWRYVHITLACLGLAAIGLHSVLELAKLSLQLRGHNVY